MAHTEKVRRTRKPGVPASEIFCNLRRPPDHPCLTIGHGKHLIDIRCQSAEAYWGFATEVDVFVDGRAVAHCEGFRRRQIARGVYTDGGGHHDVVLHVEKPIFRPDTYLLYVDGVLLAEGRLLQWDLP